MSKQISRLGDVVFDRIHGEKKPPAEKKIRRAA
jgi:hypothetical protein